VFVPRSLAAIIRPKGILPVRALDAVTRFLKSDQVLVGPNHELRAAYEARIAAGLTRPRPADEEPAAEREAVTS
jgi:hypothetical protein